MADGDKPLEPEWLFYVISFLVPLAGIIIGAIYMGKPDPECKRFGKNCLIAAIAYFVVSCVCVILLFLMYILLYVLIFGLAVVGTVIGGTTGA
jgi:hypothetical protein